MSMLPAPLTRRLAVVLAVALVLGLAGCGTSGGTSDRSADRTTSTGAGEPTADTGPKFTAVEEPEPRDDTEPVDGSEPADAPDVDPSEPCSLLTEDDAAEAFGEPVSGDADEYSDECWWRTSNDLKSVNLKVRQPDLDEWRTGHTNDSWEPVDLGDEGFVSVGPFSSVELRVGDDVYEINVNYSTSGDPDAAAMELAEAVAARL